MLDLIKLMEKYPKGRQLTVRFVSTTDPDQSYSNADFVKTDWENYATLIAKPADPGSSEIKLVPVNDYKQYTLNRPALFLKTSFYSVYVKSKGGEGLTADQVNQIIEDSLISPNYAYNMAGQRFTNFSGHQPNFFNPQVVINQNHNLYLGSGNTFPNTKNNRSRNSAGMQSVGLQLPHENFPGFRIDNLDTIDVYAQHLQMIETQPGIKYQRYPVVCEILLLIL